MGDYQKSNGTKKPRIQSAVPKSVEGPIPTPRMKSSKNHGQISDTHVIIDAAVYYDDNGKATKSLTNSKFFF